MIREIREYLERRWMATYLGLRRNDGVRLVMSVSLDFFPTPSDFGTESDLRLFEHYVHFASLSIVVIFFCALGQTLLGSQASWAASCPATSHQADEGSQELLSQSDNGVG